MDDRGLKEAHFIETLEVANHPGITHLHPFAHTLRVLKAPGNSGLDDAGLVGASRLVYLGSRKNRGITTVEGFVSHCAAFSTAEVLRLCAPQLSTVFHKSKDSDLLGLVRAVDQVYFVVHGSRDHERWA